MVLDRTVYVCIGEQHDNEWTDKIAIQSGKGKKQTPEY